MPVCESGGWTLGVRYCHTMAVAVFGSGDCPPKAKRVRVECALTERNEANPTIERSRHPFDLGSAAQTRDANRSSGLAVARSETQLGSFFDDMVRWRTMATAVLVAPTERLRSNFTIVPNLEASGDSRRYRRRSRRTSTVRCRPGALLLRYSAKQ